MKKLIFVLITVPIIGACTTENSEPQNANVNQVVKPEPETEVSNQSNYSENASETEVEELGMPEQEMLIIGDNNIGGVKLGMTSSDVQALGYAIGEGKRLSFLEGHEEEVIVLNILDDNNGRLLLQASVIGNVFKGKIHEIYVEDEYAETNKGAFKGLLIDKFIKLHPDAQLKYNFFGEQFWLVTADAKGFNFKVNGNLYKGNLNDLDIDLEKSNYDLDISRLDTQGKIKTITLNNY